MVDVSPLLFTVHANGGLDRSKRKNRDCTVNLAIPTHFDNLGEGAFDNLGAEYKGGNLERLWLFLVMMKNNARQ